MIHRPLALLLVLALAVSCGARDSLTLDDNAKSNGTQGGREDYLVRPGGPMQQQPTAAVSGPIMAVAYVQSWGTSEELTDDLNLAFGDASDWQARQLSQTTIASSPFFNDIALAATDNGFALMYGRELDPNLRTSASDFYESHSQASLVWLDRQGSVSHGPIDLPVNVNSDCLLAAQAGAILIACVEAQTDRLVIFRCDSGGTCSAPNTPVDGTWYGKSGLSWNGSGWDVLASSPSDDSVVTRIRLTEDGTSVVAAQSISIPQPYDVTSQGLGISSQGWGDRIGIAHVGNDMWLAYGATLAAYDDQGALSKGPYSLQVPEAADHISMLAQSGNTLWVLDTGRTFDNLLVQDYFATFIQFDISQPQTQQVLDMTYGCSWGNAALVTLDNQVDVIWSMNGSGLVQSTALDLMGGRMPSAALLGHLSSAGPMTLRCDENSCSAQLVEPTVEFGSNASRIGFWTVDRNRGEVHEPATTFDLQYTSLSSWFESATSCGALWWQNYVESGQDGWTVARSCAQGSTNSVDLPAAKSKVMLNVLAKDQDLLASYIAYDSLDIEQAAVASDSQVTTSVLASGYYPSKLVPCGLGYLGLAVVGELPLVGGSQETELVRFNSAQGVNELVDVSNLIVDSIACNDEQFSVIVERPTSTGDHPATWQAYLQTYSPQGSPVGQTLLTEDQCLGQGSDGNALYWALDDPSSPNALTLITASPDGSLQRQQLVLPPEVIKPNYGSYGGGLIGCDSAGQSTLEVSTSEVRLLYSDDHRNVRLGIWPR